MITILELSTFFSCVMLTCLYIGVMWRMTTLQRIYLNTVVLLIILVPFVFFHFRFPFPFFLLITIIPHLLAD